MQNKCLKVWMWKLACDEKSEISSFLAFRPAHILGAKTALSKLFCDIRLNNIEVKAN